MERVPLASIFDNPYAGTPGWDAFAAQHGAPAELMYWHVSFEKPFKDFSVDELRLKSLVESGRTGFPALVEKGV
jgi:hypothetical protein